LAKVVLKNKFEYKKKGDINMPTTCGDCFYEEKDGMYVCKICGDTISRNAFEEFQKINQMSMEKNEEKERKNNQTNLSLF